MRSYAPANRSDDAATANPKSDQPKKTNSFLQNLFLSCCVEVNVAEKNRTLEKKRYGHEFGM